MDDLSPILVGIGILVVISLLIWHAVWLESVRLRARDLARERGMDAELIELALKESPVAALRRLERMPDPATARPPTTLPSLSGPPGPLMTCAACGKLIESTDRIAQHPADGTRLVHLDCLRRL